ncbi:uncharacterized protein LOC141704569 [Apium graveolens]|uniref:uncharacterized protein LOC141704569 n=1 Tax=Apium graveolens TaxID=4045 RepID=UPI003D7B6371
MTRNVSGNKFAKSDFKKSASGSENKGKSQFKKGNMECTHCHGTNHTRDRCFHLIGFPPRNKPNINKFSRFSNVSGSKMISQLNSGADDENNIAKAPMKRVMGMGKLHGNLFKLVLPTLTSTADSSHHTVNAYSSSQLKSKAGLLSQLWHDRMGHSPVSSHGILHQMSCVHSPQQNGRAERKYKHLLAVARALKFRASLPIHLWGYSEIALFPLDTPFTEDINTSHFSSQPNSESRPITTSSHIHTDSNNSLISGETSPYTESALIITNSSETIVPPTVTSFPATLNPPVRPTRVKSIPHKFKDFTDLPNFLSNSTNCTVNYPLQSVDSITHLGSTYQKFVANSMKIMEPTTYRQVKYQADGNVDRYKARLVAKGFTQTQGIVFFQTFAPVAKMATVRVILSLASMQNWVLHQLDITNAFLHICKLIKSLYGLRQAPREWFTKFSDALLEYGYIQSKADSSLFVFHTSSTFTALLVYVNDIVLTGSCESSIKAVKDFLQSRFKPKDLGHLHYFLGIEIATSSKGIYLQKRKYALSLIHQAGLLAAKPSKITLAAQHNLHHLSGFPLSDGTPYRHLVDQLIHLTITRPELSYPVSILSQFLAKPTDIHLQTALKLIKYLKQSPG